MGPKVSLSSLNDDEYHLKLGLTYDVVSKRDDARRLAISVAIAGVKFPPPRTKTGFVESPPRIKRKIRSRNRRIVALDLLVQ